MHPDFSAQIAEQRYAQLLAEAERRRMVRTLRERSTNQPRLGLLARLRRSRPELSPVTAEWRRGATNAC